MIGVARTVTPGNRRTKGRARVPCRTVDLCRYTGDVSPTNDGWNIVDYPAYEATAVALEPGVLHLTDASLVAGSALHWTRECGAFETGTDWVYVTETVLRVVSNTGYGGLFLRVGEDDAHGTISLYPDRLELGGTVIPGCDAAVVANIDLSTDYVTLRTELLENPTGNDSFTVFVDGVELGTDLTCGTAPTVDGPWVGFGLGSSLQTAEGFIDDIAVWHERR